MIITGNHDPKLERKAEEGSIHRRDRVRRIARSIVDQHRWRIQSSREIDPVWALWFRKRKHGRRCSCWTVETSPDGHCEVCYGTGIVAPFDKYGFETHVLDTTAPARGLSVAPAPETHMRPVPFSLLAGAKRGYLEWDVKLRKSYGIDVLEAGTREEDSGEVWALFKVEGDADWTDLTSDNLGGRLSATGSTKITIRVEFRRANMGDDSPLLSYILLRHRTSERFLVPMDVPRQSVNLQVSEIGAIEVYATMRAWVTWEWELGAEDMLVTVNGLPDHAVDLIATHMAAVETKHRYDMDGKADDPQYFRNRQAVLNNMLKSDRISARLAVFGVERNEAVGRLLSQDCDLRHIQSHETLAKIPA